MTVLATPRLRLEPITDQHLLGLHTINGDPEVMHYITGKAETLDETQAMVDRVKARWAEWGFSWWAFVDLASGEVIGTGCIQYLARDMANPLEIGWRLRRDRQGQGYASEAARAMAAFAFETVRTALLLAVCNPANTASSRVMERLGMRYRGVERWYESDCATYEMTRAEWLARGI
ncbi:MAG: GNAT family N-acetyltransferase [Burkholderiaceae bacterium]|nr:GNAT family N-acetyltransferase [Burkholderiaceae bacterium]